MNDEEYYSYLRRDTSICKLPELKVDESFYKVLDTIISAKDEFKKCSSDPNPYIYSVDIKTQNDSITYEIRTLYSTIYITQIFKGAFKYNGEFFVVSEIPESDSTFFFDNNSKQVEIPFCERIYHPKYNYVTNVKNGEICIECIKNKLITIK